MGWHLHIVFPCLKTLRHVSQACSASELDTEQQLGEMNASFGLLREQGKEARRKAAKDGGNGLRQKTNSNVSECGSAVSVSSPCVCVHRRKKSKKTS